MERERDHLFDNVKAAMLFLVAFGHAIDVYKGTGGFEYDLMKWIYLFHMPVFAFVTGYFSKDAEKARATALTRALFPYLVFQGAYVVMGRIMVSRGAATVNADIFNGSILLPSSAFYYLLAVFFWKSFQKELFRFRNPLALSIGLGAAVGLTGQREFHVGLGAVFTLLPFFVLGSVCDGTVVRAVRRVPKWFWAAVLAGGAAVAHWTPYAIHSVRLTYADCGFGPLGGIAWRLLFYFVATVMGAAVLGLAPAGRTVLSRVGEGALLAYAGSTFLSPHAYVLVAGPLGLAANRAANLAGMVLFSFAVVWVCSLPPFVRTWKAFSAGIERTLLRPTPRH